MSNETAATIGPEDESILSELTEEQTARLTSLLDDYLCGLENGKPVDVDHMLDEHSDIADVLRAYLGKLDDLHGVAAGFQQTLLGAGELQDSADNALQLGDYEILREIGRGGMGIVYEARQISLSRRVALKLLPMAAMLDARHIARFKNESHAAGQLQHNSIVPVYSVGVERGIHYYAMQFIDGVSIEHWIGLESESGQSGDGRWRAVVQLMVDAADALDYAHGCGIIHRDIKPSNLLLDRDQRLWITDFGLARCRDSLSLTRSGDMVGTMRYMSPEQACGRAELVDHRTDIYSLAVTLYEMLCLRPAAGGGDGPSVLRAIDRDTPLRVRKFVPDAPADLDVVVSKAMSKERDDRYATAQEFADDLRAVLEGRPTIAKPPTVTTRAARWINRHRRIFAAASFVMALAAVWMFISTLLILQNSRAAEDHAIRADRSFRQARDTVDRLGAGVAEQLAMVPGAERVRRSVLEDTLDYYQRFVVDAANDPHLKADLALTHSRIGSIVSELESPAAAIVHYQRSAAIYDRLAESDASSVEMRRGRARNLNLWALAEFKSGATASAERLYRSAIEQQQPLIDIPPFEIADELDFSLTLSNLGLLLRETDRPEAAQQALADAVARFARLMEIEPENRLARRGMAAALGNLSSLSLQADPTKAITMLQQAIDHQVKLAEQLPNPLPASSELATSYNNLGAAFLRAAKPDQAVHAFGRAVALQRQLHALAPWVDAHAHDLATSLNNVGKAHQMGGRYRDAETSTREAIELQESLIGDKDDAAARSRLGAMLCNLAVTLESQQRIDEAARSLQSAIEQQRKATEANTESRTFREYLARHYASLLKLQVRRGQWDSAVTTAGSYRESAAGNPDALLLVAENLAETLRMIPEGRHREQAVSLVAETLESARKAGLDFDGSLLQRQPFVHLADSKTLRRVVMP